MLCWCSFQDIATMLLQVFLSRKVADCTIMDKCCLAAPLLSKMQGLKSYTLDSLSVLGFLTMPPKVLLPRKVARWSIMVWCGATAPSLSKRQGRNSYTLHWRSYFGHSYNGVPRIDYKGARWFDYGVMSWHSPLIITVARPKIIDSPLTHIFMIFWRCYCYNFWLRGRLIVRLWVNIATQVSDFPRCKAISHWRCINAHFKDIVPLLSQPLLPSKAAYIMIMCWCRRTADRIIQDASPKIIDSPLMLTWITSN
jgi:hypothetical protein